MKLLITTILILSILPSFSQTTTNIEYNYLKKGLQATFDQGLDVKQGYYFLPIETQGFELLSNAKVSALNLLRTKNNSIAGTWVKIVVTGTWSGDGTYIFVIPTPDFADGWKLLFQDISGAGATAQRAFLNFLTVQYSIKTSPNYAADSISAN